MKQPHRITEKRPHRQICGLCHRVCRVDFHVPKDVWKAAVHPAHSDTIHCLECFTERADEQLIEWGEGITFYPSSLAEHLRKFGTRELAETGGGA